MFRTINFNRLTRVDFYINDINYLPAGFANRKFEKVKIMAFFIFSRIGPRVSNVVNRNSETRVELFCVREAGHLARMIHSE